MKLGCSSKIKKDSYSRTISFSDLSSHISSPLTLSAIDSVSDSFVVRASKFSVIVTVDKKELQLSTISNKKLSTAADAVFCGVELSSGSTLFASIVSNGKQSSASIIGGEVIQSFDSIFDASIHGPPRSCFLTANEKTLDNLYLVSDDLSFSAFNSKGQLLFVRDEGLSNVRHVAFVDLPPAKIAIHVEEDDNDGVPQFPSFFRRLIDQGDVIINRLASLASIASSITSAIPLFRRSSSIDVRHQDEFGFRKLSVLFNERNYVYALETETGTKVWQLKIGEGAEKETIKWVFSLEHHHNVIVITQSIGNNGELSTSSMYHIHAIDGRIVKKISLNYLVIDAYTVPFTDHGVPVLMLVDASLEIHLTPDNQDLRQTLADHAPSLFFFHARIADGVLNGYSIESSGKGKFHAKSTWTISFPADVETISDIAVKPKEIVQSGVRVLNSDQGYLYRYLNPNLIAVATVRGPTTAALQPHLIPSVKKTPDPSVQLYLIDSVTGAIVEKYVHRGGAGPVHIAITENIVVYHYYNEQSVQYEVSAIELFEDREIETMSLGLVIKSLSGLISESTFSSFNPPAPFILQQSYAFRSPVRAIAATRTHQSITSKDFLFALSSASGSILSIPKLFLDPSRPRPESVTPQQKADGVLPYFAELPMDPLRIISYNLTLANIRSLYTTHANLESTSLVFGVGDDLFFTRVTPSQTFDLLNEDFNYPFLIASVSIVAFGIIITKRWAKAKELNSAWR